MGDVGIKPAKNIAILEDITNQEITGGLAVPTTNDRDKPEVGIVIAIGPGTKPVEFAVGDKIVYRKYMDNRIMVGTHEYNFIDFKDIIARLD